mmetsp:Transcript_19212/g.31911  ORF Transcript_19212/g.31911 Transcript_19212/m.31911 type:complete len:140 (-) Transcript_19212:115-534(-)|eukprot:CAMPEP_0119014608 /NCGR_PEP_ID=MMETSP1176-20130426/10045_1 /TAXON_ID=265551 /ORGANISM="Synedropsis recta cf, Strain CCMP1620" /LENGTH=139 /DNA_ID=CAMNT_0006967811 /DNA_START=68 /DNA_END=487 /DNA_ORIENTATION=+
MGGGNAQKSAAAREKNMKDMAKTPEERKASAAKAAADSTAFICTICRTTFMINVQPPTLYLHVTSRHPDNAATPEACFTSLKGFDPDDPKGLKKAAEEAKLAAAAAAKKSLRNSKKGGPAVDLLSLGLSTGKGKGSKKK